MIGATYIYVNEKLLREYFLKNFSDVLGKQYEIIAAIIMKGFFEKESSMSCLIGFKIKPKYEKIYQERVGEMTIDDVKNLLEVHKDEDDVVDMSIAPISSFTKRGTNSAWVIQFKRFGHYQKDANTDELIKTLDRIKMKYTSSDTILVILFDGHKGINGKDISMHLTQNNFPFSRVMFINPHKDDDEGFIDIGEFFPTYGFNQYRSNELVKKMKGL